MFLLDLLNEFLYWSVMGDRRSFAYKYTVEPLRSGHSSPNSVRISEFNLVSHAKSCKRTVMGAYMAAGYMAICTLLEDECFYCADYL